MYDKIIYYEKLCESFKMHLVQLVHEKRGEKRVVSNYVQSLRDNTA